jgi:hypothetical protein
MKRFEDMILKITDFMERHPFKFAVCSLVVLSCIYLIDRYIVSVRAIW